MSTTHAVPSRPNVIVFVSDDLGWGDLGCYGSSAIPTPTLDRLAARGMRYTDCHASSAVCTPSRYSILTGEYPWRSPMQRGVLGGTDPSILRVGQTTIATSLRDTGYCTGAFGKWHLGLGWTRKDGSRPDAFSGEFQPNMQASGWDVDYSQPFVDGPLDHGFDRFFGIAGSLDMPPYCFLDQDRTVGIPDRDKQPLITSQRPGPQVEGWQDDRCDLEFAAKAASWIRGCVNEGKPFFAYIASAAPHRPCVPPEFVRGKSSAGERGDSVVLVDWMVGELVSTLEECGVLEDTVIMFTSDNGAPLIFPEDGDVVRHHPNGPWRGQKADAWEGGHRVPLIVAGPGFEEGESAAPVTLLDLVPTIEELCGASVTDADGFSLREGGAPEDRIFSQQAFDGALVLRQGADKAIFSSGSGGFSDPVGTCVRSGSDDGQFYELNIDPTESKNLWHARSPRIAEMLSEFAAVTGFREAARDDY